MCLSQDILESTFRDKLAEYGVHVELGKGLSALEQDGESVTATVVSYNNKEPDGKEEVIKTKYLLGCDGARGVSRKFLGLSFEGETRDADG